MVVSMGQDYKFTNNPKTLPKTGRKLGRRSKPINLITISMRPGNSRDMPENDVVEDYYIPVTPDLIRGPSHAGSNRTGYIGQILALWLINLNGIEWCLILILNY